MNTPGTRTPRFLFGTGRLVIFATAAAVAIAGSRALPSFHGVLWFAIAAIAVAIWHGAFDQVLAEDALPPRFGPRWKPMFYVTYIGLGAGVLLLWWIAPVVALPLFLLYSGFHFGTEAELDLAPARLFTGSAMGLVPISAACHWWPHPVMSIFGLMLRGHAVAAILIADLFGRCLWPIVVVALLGPMLLRGPRRWETWILLATELLLFRGCSPVAAFAVFFCLWHTPEHMISTSTDNLGHFRRHLLQQHLRRGFVSWLVALTGVAIACWLGHHDAANYMGTVFIALSALTVPHMLLAELCRQNPPSSELSIERSIARQTVTP